MNSTTPTFNQTLRPWALVVLTICTFFILLGNRGLNEPDEGRYAEIGREMIETGDWLVPHFWYAPHLDKPPMTYWAVAASMKCFGQTEWAVRLPLALAGLSGILAAWLLARSIAGNRVAMWTALILQTSLLYFAMARLLTTDIFLTQFNAWAIYFFWRSWTCLRTPARIDPGEASVKLSFKSFWLWNLAGWFATALGFLTKGPVALAIPLVAFLSLAILRRKALPRKTLFFAGSIAGLMLFFALAAPWFLAVNERIPHTLDYMVFHQAAGHMAGTGFKGRHGFAFYFFVVLAIGLLPWTWLLGWLWRRSHWRQMPNVQQDAWFMLNVWAVFTFALFSVSNSKLAPYILPIFPALAILLALRFFGKIETAAPPRFVWFLCIMSPLALAGAFPLTIAKVFHASLPFWLHWQLPVMIIMAIAMLLIARKATVPNYAALTVIVSIWSLIVIVEEIPLFDVNYKANQTLKPFGSLLQKNYRAGDAVLCWSHLPEGLPFYSQGVISATNRPYLAGMNLNRVPFEFTGNLERFGDLVLTNDKSVNSLLSGDRRVLIIVDERTGERFRETIASTPVQMIGKSGQWELYSNH